VEQDFWIKQGNKPLFPELEWSRPENKGQAGKLLVIGGTGQGFAAPAEAYTAAQKSGIGTARVLLPDSLQKTVGKLFPDADFAPSTPSGSFGQKALADLLDATLWADAVLLAGDIGRNSETSVLLETLLEKYSGQVTITKDAADFFCKNPLAVAHRPDTLLVLAMGQLRQLGGSLRYPRAFTSEMGLVQLVEVLHEFTKRFAPYIITKHQGNFIVSGNGQVSTTAIATDKPIWRVQTAATASVWWLQNPTKQFESITGSVHHP
jgi:NAD(P)H-hydrate repair Nnr-like enzyme with NAD(P)H-hydrate dehydratase domain